MVVKSSGKLKAGKGDVPLWEGAALAGWSQKPSLGDRHSSRSLKKVEKGTILIPREECPKQREHPGKKPHNGYLLGAEEKSSQASVQNERSPTVTLW